MSDRFVTGRRFGRLWQVGLVPLVAVSLFGLSAVGCGVEPNQTTSSPVGGESPTPSFSSPLQTASEKEGRLAVDASGYAVKGKEVGYGMVLVNKSHSLDAMKVRIVAKLLNSRGEAVGIDRHTLVGIPASHKFYLGGFMTISRSSEPQKLSVSVIVRSWEESRLAMAEVERLRAHFTQFVAPDITLGKMNGGGGGGAISLAGGGITVEEEWREGTAVTGRIQNTLAYALSRHAWVGVVLFDKDGEVVGGGGTYLRRSLDSGKWRDFEVVDCTTATAISDVHRVEASIDALVAD